MIAAPQPWLAPLAALFRLGQGAYHGLHDRGLLPREAVRGITTIVVGNLQAGGSGKTPLVLFLAEHLARRGARPGIVSVVRDEALLFARRLPGVPVVVDRDRIRATRRLAALGCRIALHDDGFQHRRLVRDLDVLLLQGADLAANTRFLPAGRAREPLAARRRAGLVGALDDGWPADAPVDFRFRLEPTALVDAGQVERAPRLDGQRALLVSGIARPERLAATAHRLGAEPVGHLAFADHHRYSATDRARIRDAVRATRADLALSTEKDLARGLDLPGLTLVAPRLALRLTHGAGPLLTAVEDLVPPAS